MAKNEAASPPHAVETDTWAVKKLLVLGMTYPTYSTKYQELVCTGAIEVDTKRLVRVHPMPKRYLDDGQGFKNFQHISARVQKNRDDPRPESLRVDFRSVEVLDEIPSKKPDERRSYLENSPSLVRSVEALQELNRSRSMSMGIIIPKSIDDIHIRKRNDKERAEWNSAEEKLMSQENLPFLRPLKKIDFPEAEFKITWSCDDPRCTGHTSGLKSWSIHELYRKLTRKGDNERDAKTMAKLKATLNLETRDLFLFMGTFHNHQTTFGLMDVYAPPKRKGPTQIGLFK